jgi:hypothetical protein
MAPEALLDAPSALRDVQRFVGPCREWIDEKCDRCNEPSEYVLWGKLIPADGLGPRCYDHAAKWVSASALAPNSGYALVDLAGLVEAVRKGDQRGT